MNRLTKVWHDPVLSAVIAGIILVVITPAVTYFLNWWPAIGEFGQTVYRFALLPSSFTKLDHRTSRFACGASVFRSYRFPMADGIPIQSST
jgi:hypothetical protein